MTIEEKITEVAKTSPTLDGLIVRIKSICQEEIKSACDKQKEICADIWQKHEIFTDTPLYDQIKQAPYPEVVNIILSTGKDDNNNFNNHSIKCECLDCSDVVFRKLE